MTFKTPERVVRKNPNWVREKRFRKGAPRAAGLEKVAPCFRGTPGTPCLSTQALPVCQTSQSPQHLPGNLTSPLMISKQYLQLLPSSISSILRNAYLLVFSHQNTVISFSSRQTSLSSLYPNLPLLH